MAHLFNKMITGFETVDLRIAKRVKEKSENFHKMDLLVKNSLSSFGYEYFFLNGV